MPGRYPQASDFTFPGGKRILKGAVGLWEESGGEAHSVLMGSWRARPAVDLWNWPGPEHRTAHLQVCHNLLHLGPADIQETLNQVSVDEAGGRFCLSLSMKGSPGGQAS